MEQAIVSNFENIMEKYDKNYDRDGVMANLDEWYENKHHLADILRKHPAWNEDELAIIFEIEEAREIDQDDVRFNKEAIIQMARQTIDGDERYTAIDALNTIVSEYSSNILTNWTVSQVKPTNVNCVIGQKSSRVFNAVCKKYGIDKHPDYARYFAALADGLNPIQVKKKATLSVNPCDYLEMSNGSSWKSCHRLNGGEYQAGTLSYMNDSVSMIFSTVKEEVTQKYHTAPKLTRQVFAYGNGILLQSRLYPYTDDNIARDNYRILVQKAIADCLEVPNLWILKKDQEEIGNRCYTHDDALHYDDYNHSCYSPNVSLLKAMKPGKDDAIEIGYTAYCVNCAEELNDAEELTCGDCNKVKYHCCDCGCEIDEDDIYWMHRNAYCSDCVQCCDRCGNTVPTTVTVHDEHGYEIYVCEHCRDLYYFYCVSCDEYHHMDHGDFIDGQFYCQDCILEDFTDCEDCGMHIHDYDIQEIDGHFYCKDCMENHAIEDDEEVAEGA